MSSLTSVLLVEKGVGAKGNPQLPLMSPNGSLGSAQAKHRRIAGREIEAYMQHFWEIWEMGFYLPRRASSLISLASSEWDIWSSVGVDLWCISKLMLTLGAYPSPC